VICTHCSPVAKPLSESQATGGPKTLRETVGQWVKRAGTTTSSPMLTHMRNIHGLPANETEEDRIRADHGLLVGKKRKAHEIDPEERDTAVLEDRSEAWKLRKKDEPFRPEVSRKLLAIAKAATNSPSTMIENPHWINFFRYNQPEFLVMSHQTWDRDVEELYRKEKERVKGELVRHLKRGGKFCLTFDGWSSNRRMPYLGITVHYIDRRSWTLRHTLLVFRHFPGSHTAEQLSKFTSDAVKEWNIDGTSIRTITSDSDEHCLVSHTRE
jgi:hypothetical protein